MRIKDLTDLLEKKVSVFAAEHRALGWERRETKKHAAFSLYTNLLHLQFLFSKKEAGMLPIATLFCRVYLQKNKNRFFHMPELLDLLPGGEEDFRCWYFPYIDNEARLDACFGALSAGLTAYLPALQDLANDPDRLEAAYARQWQEWAQLHGLKEENVPEDEKYYSWEQGLIERFFILPKYTNYKPYQCFLSGDRAEAAVHYRKVKEKSLSAYERRLLVFLESPESEGYTPADPACICSKWARSYAKGSREFGWGVLYFLVCLAVFGGLCLAVYGAADALLTRGAVYKLCGPWYMGLVLGGLPALFGAMALRRTFVRVLRRRRAQEILEFDELVYGRGFNRFLIVLFCLALAASLFASVLFAFGTVCFYGDRMAYWEADLPLEKREYRYEEIVGVYHLEGRYNDFGDWIDRSSYGVKFTDGTLLDFDWYFTDEAEVEAHVLPLLPAQVTPVRCEEEIP